MLSRETLKVELNPQLFNMS
jgi:hypothetical protein